MPNDDYLRFNVGSIDELIKEKLREQFPDVDYRGSSANIISETISSVMSLVMYQVNRNVANNNFEKTQSINSLINIVNQIGYSPTGWQAGSIFMDVETNSTLPQGNYVIPRYSFVETDFGRFSNPSDIVISYDGSDTSVASDVPFLKGSWIQSQPFNTNAQSNETLKLVGNSKIDHNNIHVYVKGDDGLYIEYERVQSLFTSQPTDKHFEARYGQNGSYTIEFGDDINGCIPDNNSEVIVYYLSVSQNGNIAGVGSATGQLAKYSSNILDQFLVSNNQFVKGDYLSVVKGFFDVTNSTPSTQQAPPESITEIKKNAPLAFKTQNRLVTKEDYKSFILSNFSTIISDVKVLSNEEYLDQYIKHYYDLGLDKPELESRALYSQIKFSNSCNFNNVYVFLIPVDGVYLNESQKRLIINKVDGLKTLTSDVIPIDPIYINFGVATTGSTDAVIGDINNSYIEITKNSISNRSDNDIRQEVYEIITDYFTERSTTFDNTININDITSLILSSRGVQSVRTVNGDVSNNGVNFYQYNNGYPDQVYVTPPTSQFEGIFVANLIDEDLLSKIVVV